MRPPRPAPTFLPFMSHPRGLHTPPPLLSIPALPGPTPVSTP
ncbi:hypothetical protein E2C01_083721 [Portunus trituberculatus]|uniref:Uncharacterized protein n=1 Tax=Portunus trituberculatus TaxID=210409 RepID=A0A5B7IVX0_PORTR|nr:hypothetical protein [Portunus trituberculatus]